MNLSTRGGTRAKHVPSQSCQGTANGFGGRSKLHGTNIDVRRQQYSFLSCSSEEFFFMNKNFPSRLGIWKELSEEEEEEPLTTWHEVED